MTESEKRRLDLLQQTRMLYSEKHTPPAIHPRFHAAYANLYGNNTEEEKCGDGTFGIRMFIAVILFFAFVALDYKNTEYAAVNSTNIVNEIEKQTEDVFAEFM